MKYESNYLIINKLTKLPMSKNIIFLFLLLTTPFLGIGQTIRTEIQSLV